MHRTQRVSRGCAVLLILAAVGCGGDDDDNSTEDAGPGSAGRSGTGGTRAGNGGTAAGGTSAAGNRSGSGGSGGAGGAISAGSGGRAAGAGGAAAGSGGAAVTDLSDAQIALIAMNANMGEVEQNALAVDKAQASAVRSYAQQLVAMHNAALNRENTLVSQLAITPADSSVAMQLRAKSTLTVSTLQATGAADFDRVYLQTQIDGHVQVLGIIDTTLAPNADAAELKAELALMRAEVVIHLDHARELLGDLSDADAGVDAGY